MPLNRSLLEKHRRQSSTAVRDWALGEIIESLNAPIYKVKQGRNIIARGLTMDEILKGGFALRKVKIIPERKS